MFASYEVLATFGISAVVSFSVSAVVLLVVAARRGLLRVGAMRKVPAPPGRAPPPGALEKGQPAASLLLAPSAPPAPLPMYVELAPLKGYNN